MPFPSFETFTSLPPTWDTGSQLLEPLSGRDIHMMEFKKPSMQIQYDMFRKKESSSWMIAAYLVCQTLFQTFLLITSLRDSFGVAYAIFRIARALAPIPGWLLLYSITYPRHSHWLDRYASARRLGDFYITFNAIAMASTLLFRAIAGECSNNAVFSRYDCNPMESVHALPQDILVVLVFGNIFVHIMIKCYTFKILLLNFFIAFFSILAAIIIANATSSIVFLLAHVGVFAILFIHEHNNLRVYMALRNMEHTGRKSLQTENDKSMFERQSLEIRALMGNVAHDLKTPMQSFVMDLEGLEKLIQPHITSNASSVSLTHENLLQIAEAIRTMTDTNTFMTMVVNRAIDYTKCSSGYTLTPNLLTINITETIEWAIRIVSGKSRVPIVFEPLPSNICSHIITDRQWLIENILCLVSNATKFTMHGSVTVRCELQVESVNGEEYICFDVEDSGIGIPAEMRGMMFRPFQQTMRMAGGTGLGLYSLHKRVEVLQGTCGICDRRDGAQGACVWFRIPYRWDPDAAAEEKRLRRLSPSVGLSEGDIELGLSKQAVCNDVAPSLVSSKDGDQGDDAHSSVVQKKKVMELSGTVAVAAGVPLTDSSFISEVCSSSCSMVTAVPDASISNKADISTNHSVSRQDVTTRAKNILLVDDSLIVRKSVSRALAAEGFVLELAENGVMGLEMMQARMYDLVLLDIQMPMMDGLEAAKRLRRFESDLSNRHQNIVGISAFSGDQVRSDALCAGMDGFIEKPFKVGALLEICRSCGFPLD